MRTLRIPDIPIGTEYERLTTTSEPYIVKMYGGKKIKCMARCKCGVEKEVLVNHLIAGRTVSCGCTAKTKHQKICFPKKDKKR